MTKKSRKPLLITGHRGYLGSVMAPYFLKQGYDVIGLDVGYFNECTLVPDPVEIPEIAKDIRDLVPDDVKSFYAIIHLAALSNDPIGNLDETWTEDINPRASVRLAELAREAPFTNAKVDGEVRKTKEGIKFNLSISMGG